MAENLGSVYASLDLDTKGFAKGIKDASHATNNLDNNISGNMKNAKNATKSLSDSLFNVKNLLIGIATSVGIKKGFDWTVGANANMEQYQTTLATVLKSEEKAITMLQWAEDFSSKTPFEIPQLVEATVKLESYGLSAKNVMGNIGDMAAIMGKDLMQAVEAVADAQTGELERLKEFGITKNMIIDQATKIGIEGIVNAKGQITDMAQFNTALMSLMEERFEDGMKKQSENYKGMLSNLSDEVNKFGRNAGVKAFELVKEEVSNMLTKIQELKTNGTLDKWANEVGDAIAGAMELAIKFGKGIGFLIENHEILTPLVGGLVASLGAMKIINTVIFLMNAWKNTTFAQTVAQKGLNVALKSNPIGIVVTAIGLLVAAGIALYKNWDTVVEHLKKAWETMKYWGTSIFNAMKIVVLLAVQKMLESVQTFIGWIPGLKDKIADAKSAIDGMIDETLEAQKTRSIEHENRMREISYEKLRKTLTDDTQKMQEADLELIKGMKSNSSEAILIRNSELDHTVKTNEAIKTSNKSLFDSISQHLSSISSMVQGSIGIIEKKLELWRVKNNETKDSSEYLSKQLEIQKEKHNLLNSEIGSTEEALAKVISRYGEGSKEAIELKNTLLDLQLEQANLTNEINGTTDALKNMANTNKVLTQSEKNERFDQVRRALKDPNIDKSFWETYNPYDYAVGKFHTGGVIPKLANAIPGLKRDEVPIIAQAGEVVIPRGGNVTTSSSKQININIYGGDRDRIYQTVRHALGGNV